MFKYENSDSVLIGFNQHFLLPENIHERIFYSNEFGAAFSGGITVEILDKIENLFGISKQVQRQKLLILYVNTYLNNLTCALYGSINFNNNKSYLFNGQLNDNLRLFIDLSKNVDDIVFKMSGAANTTAQFTFNLIDK